MKISQVVSIVTFYQFSFDEKLLFVCDMCLKGKVWGE